MKKIKIFLALIATVLFVQVANAQTVTGTVSDQNGDPVPGASVKAKGITGVGTVTKPDGSYSLDVRGAEVLVFSFVGLETKEEAIDGRSTIDVTLRSEDIGIGEVVVTALGMTREKKALGYAVQEVGGDDISKAQQSDVLSALSGRVSGVEIRSSSNLGGSSRILIRGANSITGENQPLIVVDGIPLDNSSFNSANTQAGYGGTDYGNMLNDLNPDEIENISVLKGAAAALYGSRAANGVIVVTTKKADKGREAFDVNVSSAVNFEQMYLLPNLQTKYGGGSIISEENGGVDGFQVVTVDGNDYKVPQFAVDESWGPKYDENIMVAQWDAWGPNGELIGEPRPWVAPENDVLSFYDLGVSYVNTIGVTKSGEDYGIRASYRNQNTTGTFPGSEQLKNDFRLTGNASLTKKLTVDASLNFSNQYTKGRPEIGYGDNSTGQKFFQWGQRQLDYEMLEDYKYSDGTQRTWNRKAYNDPTPKYADNPYWTAYENAPEDERDRFYGNVSVSYEIIDNLVAKGSVYGDNYTFYIREKVAVGSQAQPRYYEAVRNNSEYNYEGTLNYSNTFDQITVNALLGANKRYTRLDMNRGQSSGGLVVPEVYNLLNSVDDPLVNDFTREKEVNSAFGMLSLDYAGLIYLEATARNDWSSTLPEDNNSYFYPSVSGSFIFSELIDMPWFNLGKVRVGWSQVGNDTDPYNVVATYNYNANGSFQAAPRLFVEDDMVNSNLLPEQTTSIEAGLDLVFLNNRAGLNFTYFDNVTTDQILPLEVSKATGYDTKFINAGKMANKGFEASLHLVPVQINEFSWEIDVNYTTVENTVEELYGDLESMDIVRAPFGGVFLRASVGDTYGQLWGHDYLYDDDGNRLVHEYGLWKQNPNLTPLGSVFPDYNMGIRNTINFKGLSFSFLFDIQKGGKFYSLTHMWGMYSGMLEETAGVNDQGNEIRDAVSAGGGIKLDGVTGDVEFNDDGSYTVTNTAENETYIPASWYGAYHYHGFGMPSAQSVFDADYIKLREATISYTLPVSIFQGYIKSVTVSAYGRNLLTFGLDQEGFDPEMTVGGSGNIQGIDGGLQPVSRTMGFKLNLQF